VTAGAVMALPDGGRVHGVRRWLPWSALGATGPLVRLVILGGSSVRAAAILAGVAVVWAMVLAVLVARSRSSYVVLPLVGILAVLVTGPFLGRDSLVVGVAGVLVVDAAIRRSEPSLPWHRRGSGVSVLALVVLVAAEYHWMGNVELWEVGLLLALAYGLAVAPLPLLFTPSASAAVAAVPSTAELRRRWHLLAGRVRRVAAHPATRSWAVGGLIGLAWAPVYWRLVNTSPAVAVLGINDFPLHLEVARDFSLVPFRTNAPHFLFHAVTAAWSLVLSSSVAPVVALSSATALSYVALVTLFEAPSRAGERLSTSWAQWLALGYFFAETPTLLALFTGLIPSTSPLYTVHWWPNPTWLMALPFMFLTLPLIERVIDDAVDERDSSAGVMLGAVTVLGAIAKPGLALCLIPALPVYALFVRRSGAVAFRRLLLWCVLPGAAVIVWQTWFLGLSSASQFSSGWTIDPIVDAPFGWSNIGVEFFAPFLPVVLAAVATRGRFFRERSVQLVLLCSTIAYPLMLFVRETDERAQHGNLAVPTQACMTLLIALAVRSLAQEASSAVRERSDAGRRPPALVVVSAVVAAAFLAAGVLSLLDGVGAVHVPIDWLETI
jgi:hypothetical protein